MVQNFSINIHAIIPHSRINGPGNRMVIFFQGCMRGCTGCFNPDTHSSADRNRCSPEDIFGKYPAGAIVGAIEGITISGGEPFLQAAGLYRLLKTAREKYGLSTIVYTGFTYKELAADSEASSCFRFMDVLVDGGYDESKKETTLLARGSTNQEFHFLSAKYTKEDFYMPGKSEIIISKEGLITETGFSRIDIGIN